MPVYLLDETMNFPPVHAAEPDGLLAVGGDLKPDRLLAAYRSGIFPWYDENPILWWSPDPRFVLFPEDLRISKSMRSVLSGRKFNFRMNTAFTQVMNHCGQVKRTGQDSSWINGDMINAYTKLHEMGYAMSAESWMNGQLAGGLYGILIDQVFFGESMFSLEPNASKFAFINWVQQLKSMGVQIIDCQVYTSHLESLGAKMISREHFLQYINHQK